MMRNLFIIRDDWHPGICTVAEVCMHQKSLFKIYRIIYLQTFFHNIFCGLLFFPHLNSKTTTVLNNFEQVLVLKFNIMKSKVEVHTH